MWFRGIKNTLKRFIVILVGVNVFKGCETITNADFNKQIRDYSAVEDLNISDVKTLQKQGLGLSRYADFAPVQKPIKFKNVPDSVISGSSHGRGLLHQGHIGYGFDYDEPHYGQGYEYQLHNDHHDHDPHDYNHNHYDFHGSGHHHSPGHHHGYGHQHKYYDHGLATKTLLWPIAGIALLGAAAALVSNPVLLSLGVVSGKRRRRHVDEIDNIANNSIQKWSQMTSAYKENNRDANIPKILIKKKLLRKENFKVVNQVLQSGKGNVHETVNNVPKRYSAEERRFIPIPLKINNP